MEERLQKILSAAGVCSRRASESYILAGRITINGRTAELGQRADPEMDEICLDGCPITKRPDLVYIMLNKPRGYVTTVSDEQGRRTVMDLIRDIETRVYPVGRLDRDSEGLLLLTNDGELTHKLLHPSHMVSKCYHVQVSGPIEGAALKLSRIRDVGGQSIQPAQVETLWEKETSAEYSIVIHEGRNRQIRRMCAICDLDVKRLRRVKEHALELGDLPIGKWRYLTEREITALKAGSIET